MDSSPSKNCSFDARLLGELVSNLLTQQDLADCLDWLVNLPDGLTIIPNTNRAGAIFQRFSCGYTLCLVHLSPSHINYLSNLPS
jgi:hypothetical protein